MVLKFLGTFSEPSPFGCHTIRLKAFHGMYVVAYPDREANANQDYYQLAHVGWWAIWNAWHAMHCKPRTNEGPCPWVPGGRNGCLTSVDDRPNFKGQPCLWCVKDCENKNHFCEVQSYANPSTDYEDCLECKYRPSPDLCTYKSEVCGTNFFNPVPNPGLSKFPNQNQIQNRNSDLIQNETKSKTETQLWF